MTDGKANTVVGHCVIDLTKYIMSKDGLSADAAYRKLFATELYKLLNDYDTRLFLEDGEYLKQAYDTETSAGVDALYEFIRPEP